MRQLRVGIRRRAPRPRHLRGTVVHRWLGDRLFDPRLWSPTPHEVAAGLALGVFVALTPTFGVQLILATVAAYFLRINLSAALLACWVTNPLTAPFIYRLEYQLGTWIGTWFDDSEPKPLAITEDGVSHFAEIAQPIWIGSLAAGGFAALTIYVATRFAWDRISHIFPGHRRPGRDWRALRRTSEKPPATSEGESKPADTRPTA